jgi:hypothetical protein
MMRLHAVRQIPRQNAQKSLPGIRRLFSSLGWLTLVLALFVGCQELSLFRTQSPDWNDDDEDEHKTAEEYKPELVGNYAVITGNNVIAIHGVGLVVGLDNTGEDPPASAYRSQVLKEMQAKGVKNPNAILADPKTAIVQLTAYLPADIQKGQPFDVEVRFPPESNATSLAGGWLLETHMTEAAMLDGVERKGHEMGRVSGPILVTASKSEKVDNGELAGVLRRGRILGGGIALKDRPLGMYLRNDFRSVRNSRRIADVIGRRFHYYDRGIKKPMADAKTDQYIVLKVHPRYKDNYPRYMQVIRNIAFRETPVQQHDRVERLKEELLTPKSSARAAIQLEAIGAATAPILKSALSSADPECRFYAAEALAYMGEDAGAVELGKAARDEPAFRVYALAALASLDEAASFYELRKLLNQPSAETRYGAFRALWTLDKNDPAIKAERLNDQFDFHVLDSETEPMVHMTRNKLSELVLFGRDQRFHTPIALTAGPRINVNAQPGSDTVSITRFEVGQPDRRKVVSTRVEDVIRAVAEMDATYPDVAQLLAEAEGQNNLPGRLEIDALPTAGRLYYRPVKGKPEAKGKGTRVGRKTMIPNLFPTNDPDSSSADEPPEQEEETIVDSTEVRKKKSDPDAKKSKKKGIGKYLEVLDVSKIGGSSKK